MLGAGKAVSPGRSQSENNMKKGQQGLFNPKEWGGVWWTEFLKKKIRAKISKWK